VPTKHYVYYLTLNQELVYIGRSTVPQSRLRAFQRRINRSAVLYAVLEFDSFNAAAAVERSEIAKFRPTYNKYVASSSCRLGKTNTKNHNAALSRGVKKRTKGERRAAALLCWEIRDRSGHLFSHPHSAESRIKSRNRTIEQFNNPEKRERHRLACIAATERRRAAGLPFGRANKCC
jgi:hypothetical protein